VHPGGGVGDQIQDRRAVLVAEVFPRAGEQALAPELTEAALTPNASGERISDELCARASAHYDHKALWTLTVAIGHMCFFIPVALIGKPIPGTEPHWSK